MADINIKRAKSKNFSSTEEEELMALVRKYWSIIQCKITDHKNNMRKKEYWKKIEEEFNASSSTQDCFRSANVLKCKFENITRKARQKVAINKKILGDTGGGPDNSETCSSIEEQALSLLGSRATGFKSKWCDDEKADKVGANDLDEELIDNPSETVIVTSIDSEDESSFNSTNADDFSNYELVPGGSKAVSKKDDTEELVNGDWSKDTPSMLKTPRAEPLRFFHDKNTTAVAKKQSKSVEATKSVRSQSCGDKSPIEDAGRYHHPLQRY